MGRPALRIEVKPKDQEELARLLSGGVQQVRFVLRAAALLRLAKGVSAPRISSVIPLTPQAIRKVGHRCQAGGLEPAFYDKQRPGAASVLKNSRKQRIIAVVCGAGRQRTAPAGPCDWRPRKRYSADWSHTWEGKPPGFCSSTTTSNRGGKGMWRVAELNDEYIAKMEDVLETYERPYDLQEAVVCQDEKPVTLRADVRLASPAEPGREARRDSEYERRGTAYVVCPVEP